MLTVTVEDASGVLGLRFLNFYPSHLKLFQPGESFRFNGDIRDGFLGLEMVHPRFSKADDTTPLPTQLTPVYPTTAGLGQATLRKLVTRALEAPIIDTLPADWLAELGLPDWKAASACCINRRSTVRWQNSNRTATRPGSGWRSTNCWRSNSRSPLRVASGAVSAPRRCRPNSNSQRLLPKRCRLN